MDDRDISSKPRDASTRPWLANSQRRSARDANPSYDLKRRGQLLKVLDAVWPKLTIEKDRQLDALRALNRVLDSRELGYWVWDLRSNSLQVSDRWANAMGLAAFTPDSGLAGLLPALDNRQLAELRELVDAHLRGFTAKVRHEFRMTDSAGLSRWIRFNAVVERDDSNNPLVLAGTVRDFTAERNTDAHSGFLNERGLCEAIEDYIAAGERPILIAIDGRCNRCRMNDLEPGLRRRFRIELVDRITATLSGNAVLTELRQDYFGILLQNAPSHPGGLHTLAERILRSIRGVGKPLLADFLIDATIGAAGASNDYLSTGTELIEQAIRNIGREIDIPAHENQRHEETMELRAGTTSSTVSMIRRALSEDAIIPFFQPIVSVKNRELVGYEALVRLEHPTRGFIPPSEFLSTAELSEQIIEIGEVMLNKSLGAIAAHQLTSSDNQWPTISINVSGRQLSDERLPKVILFALEKAGVPASQLRIELTETTLVPNIAFASRMLNGLRAKGVKIALDDFGSGFSSLAYLHDLPIDVIKADRRFVRNAQENPARRAILETIGALSKALNIPVIAEGVETEEEAQLLLDIGIEFAQGYLFAKPQPQLNYRPTPRRTVVET